MKLVLQFTFKMVVSWKQINLTYSTEMPRNWLFLSVVLRSRKTWSLCITHALSHITLKHIPAFKQVDRLNFAPQFERPSSIIFDLCHLLRRNQDLFFPPFGWCGFLKHSLCCYCDWLWNSSFGWPGHLKILFSGPKWSELVFNPLRLIFLDWGLLILSI